MNTREPLATTTALLRSDPLRHVVTLKMIHMYGSAVTTTLVEDASGWALLSRLPTSVSDYDRHAYPETEEVVLIDGTSATGKRGLLDTLGARPAVVKTYDDVVRDHLVRRLGATPTRAFVSFTASSAPLRGAAIPGGEAAAREVVESSDLTDDAIRMFAENGYGPAELARYVADGATWFGVRRDGRLVAACLAFRNFHPVWEIGGVFTEPEHRRQGHARSVVARALSHVLGRGLIPRYQVDSNNRESLRLAEAAGLRVFVRIDHYRLTG